MKRWYCAFLLLAAMTCGRTDFQARLALEIPPIPDGEVCNYRVLARNDSVGSYTTLVRHDWLGDEELPVFGLMVVMRIATGKVATTDSSVVLVRRNNLLPRSSFRFIRTGAALSTTAANYSDKSVAVSSYIAGEEKQRLLPVSTRTFDIDQLTFLGRSLKFDKNKPVKITVINTMGPPAGGGVLDAEFTLLGDEMVTVPAGTYDCRRVMLKAMGAEIELCYEKYGTGRLVRYRAEGAGMTIELLPAPPEPVTDGR
jgi:hypothetical protein